MKYKVLWIDDLPNDEFLDAAHAMDMDIQVATCYETGIEWLRVNQDICMAVILDVKCKISEDPTEVPSRDAFRDKWLEVVKLCNEKEQIPWFVYTAGDYDGIEALDILLPKDKKYDPNRQYYRKPVERKTMLANIVQAINLNDMTAALKEYENIFDFCSEYYYKELFRIIINIKKNEYTNSTIFNDMRKVLGWSTSYMREHGMLPNDITNFNKAALYLNRVNFACKDNDVDVSKTLVPDYIKNSFMACQYVCNNGSHSKAEGASDEADNCLVVDEDVKNGVAPYLIRSTFFELLTIITWCKGLPTTQEGIDALRADIDKLNIPWIIKSEKTK